MIGAMPTDRKSLTGEEWDGFQKQCMFSGLRDVEVGDDADVGYWYYRCSSLFGRLALSSTASTHLVVAFRIRA
jgi:hypothetical protein